MRTPNSSLRSLKLAAVTTAVVASSLSLAPTALAAAPAPAAVPLVAQYGGAGCSATIDVTVAVKGTTIVITVRCNGKVVVVRVTIRSTPTELPVVAADANGVSTYPVDTSNLELGAHTVDLEYSDGTTQTLPFTVIAAQASGVPAGGGSASGGGTPGGGLAFTGANAVVPLGALGAVLVLGGAGAVIAGRRRRDDIA